MRPTLAKRCLMRSRPLFRNSRRVFCPSVLAITLALTAHPGWSACTVSASGVIFGNYDTLSNVARVSTGDINVTCDLLTPPYTILLSPGNGTYASRAMSGGGTVLQYNLYTDPTHLIVWGDGTGGTSVGAGLATGANQVHTVYGRIPAAQNVPVGTYSDMIIVTVTF
jgi:spore coat protein U-like protein